MFLVPILLVATISIFHVITWYNLSNPLNWAIFLSVAIEIGAITALIAVTNKIKGGVWFMFILVTIIQMVGNIFYSYKEIDENGDLFKSWVELTYPIWEYMGTDKDDIVGLKRWLSFLTGGLLPIISLTSLHFFVKYEDPKSEKPKQDIDISDIEVTKEKLEQKDKLPKHSETINETPTVLVNSQHREEDVKITEVVDEKPVKKDELKKGNTPPQQKLSKTWRNAINLRSQKNNNIQKL